MSKNGNQASETVPHQADSSIVAVAVALPSPAYRDFRQAPRPLQRQALFFSLPAYITLTSISSAWPDACLRLKIITWLGAPDRQVTENAIVGRRR
jgi:hypothetical protein